MGWFQSEKMKYIQIIMHRDAAHGCVTKLGELEGGAGACQFTDLNTDLTLFQREYIPQIKRCDEMERMIRYFKDECVKDSITIPPIQGPWNAAVTRFQDESLDLRQPSPEALIQRMEEYISNEYNALTTLNQQYGALSRANTELRERMQVLSRCNEWGPDVSGVAHNALSSSDAGAQVAWQYLCGIVPTEERIRFERMIFRATRGNVFIKFWEVAEAGEAAASKYVFIMVFKSERIERKLRKLCSAHHATTYQVSPDQYQENMQGLKEAQEEIQQQQVALRRVGENRARMLHTVIAKNLEVWRSAVRLQKATYHTLNLFKVDKEVMNSPLLKAEGWAIEGSCGEIERVVKNAHSHLGNDLGLVVNLQDHHSEPPTHFKLNKYSQVFQELVDTYGIARYREINPAVFTAVTFPFLFGVMYGDIGHGVCLLLAGLYLVMTENQREGKKLDELMSGLHGGRYMLLLMGIFAVYCGLVYNDMFSVSLDAMPGGTQWEYVCGCEGDSDVYSNNFTSGMDCHSNLTQAKPGTVQRCSNECCFTNHHELGVIPKDAISKSKMSLTPEQGVMGGFAEGYVYPFGMDPLWKGTSNELMFFNSFKMKISVILGISQMVFGICLKGLNSVFIMRNSDSKAAKHEAWYDFIHEFVPQILFASCLFVYMIILIVFKWTVNWQVRGMDATLCREGQKELCNTYCDAYGDIDCTAPPSLINTLIDIALSIGTVADPMFNSQASLQTYLLLVAVLCVPWMLLVKPLLLRAENKKADTGHVAYDENPFQEGDELMTAPAHGGGGGHGHGGEFNFGEVMIHQAIETIEFVLGMISNTASYLRLWALSLAHSELALVFWEKVMKPGIAGGPLAAFVAFAIFASITTSVLLLMDVLECFLHALRLHWVEFQNKFYKADGYKFEPLGFGSIVKNLD